MKYFTCLLVKTDDNHNCSLSFLPLLPDKMKDGIIAKLANQAADYYGDAYKQCQYKDTLPKVSNSHGNNPRSAVIVNNCYSFQCT